MMPLSFHEMDELEAIKEERKLAIEVAAFNGNLVGIFNSTLWYDLE